MKQNQLVKQFFKDTSTVLQSEYDRSKSLKHKTLKGKVRENFVNNFLHKTFPEKFVIGNGEIIDSDDNKSDEADVIVYDEHMPVLDYGGIDHFLSGGVLAHTEVKTKLTKGTLTDALEVTDSIKNLNRDLDATMHFGSLPETIFSCIFAYEGMSPESFKRNLLEYYDKKSSNGMKHTIDLVCVLNQYVLVKRPDSKQQITFAVLDTKEDSLLAFFSELFGAMYKNWQGVPDLYKYTGEMGYDVIK